MSGSKRKEPKSWNLAILAGITLAVLAALAKWGGEGALAWGNLILAVSFGLASLCLAVAFRRQLCVELYSYNTIFFAGFSLFLLSLFVTHAWAAAQGFLHPETFHAEQMLYTLLHSAKNYMFLTSPVLILFSAALFVSNIALIRHEGRRFVNLLGILLALTLVLGEVVVAVLDFRSAFTTRAVLLQNMIVNLAAALYLYFECMIVGAVTADIIAARRVPQRDRDFLIVLGCGLKKDGTPTPLLRGRLQCALDFARRERDETGKTARFVVSGGQGADEAQSEAASMRAWLMEEGVEEEQILTEDRSTDTAENMRFSRDVMDGAQPGGKAAFFTTNYHVFRAGLKARRAGLAAQGMGAPTRWYFWPNAAVREFVGLLTEHWGKQGFVLLLLIVSYATLTVMAYG